MRGQCLLIIERGGAFILYKGLVVSIDCIVQSGSDHIV